MKKILILTLFALSNIFASTDVETEQTNIPTDETLSVKSIDVDVIDKTDQPVDDVDSAQTLGEVKDMIVEPTKKIAPQPTDVVVEDEEISVEPGEDKAVINKEMAADTEETEEMAPPAENILPVKAEPLSTIGKSAVKGQEARENTKPFSRISNFSDPSRFTEIKIKPKAAINEIDFWARQMSEHALFIFLGLTDEKLRNEALKLHKQFEAFRNAFNQNPKNLELLNKVLPLLQAQRKHQVNILKTLDEGKWIGWLFPLFINHVTLELDYFVDKLNGIKYTPEDEVLFWNRINSEHAAFAAHLLDPAERKLFVKADKMSMKFIRLPKSEKEMFIKLSLEASKQLDEFNKTAKKEGKAVKSVIHPVLLDHVIREGERSIKTLEALGLKKQAAKFANQYKQQVEDYAAPQAAAAA